MAFTLTGDRDDLLPSLELAAKFVAKHSSTAGLGGVHVLRNADTHLSYVEASDQRMSVRAHLWGTFDADANVLAHPSLARAVKAMAAGEVVVECDDGATELTVRGAKGRGRYQVPLLDGEAPNMFPGAFDINWDDIAEVDATDALKMMRLASGFVSPKESNPSITGVNLRVVDDHLGVEATDGHRLFHDRVTLPVKGFPFDEDEVLLPVRMVSDLLTVFPAGEVKFAATTNLFFARDPNGERMFASRRIGGKFPDLEQIVPKYEKGVQIPRVEISEAVGRMRTMVTSKPIILSFQDKVLTLTSRGDTGAAEEVVDLPANAEKLVIAFTIDYLNEALSLFDGDTIWMRVLTPLRPVRIDDGGDRLFLLTPTRVA